GFSFAKADAIYTAILVDVEHLSAMPGLPADGLARFQFLEVLVNCALTEPSAGLPALRHWLQCLGLGRRVLSCRKALHAVVFTEDCCAALRKGMKLFQDVYSSYQKRFRLAETSGLMSFNAWVQFLADCPGYSADKASFALAKEISVDQHRHLRHMALSWSEFLVAVAAAVWLEPSSGSKELPDRLLDFVLDTLPEALHAGRAAEIQEAGDLARDDPRHVELVRLVTRIFKDADVDGSGLLTSEEFQQAFSEPRTSAALEEAGLLTGDMKLLFLRMDVDGSGSLTLKEFVEGLLKLQNEMIVLDKGIREVRKAFLKVETKVGIGKVNRENFLAFVRNPANADLLKRAGLRESDASDLWEAAQQAISRDPRAEVTAEALVAGYMDLHLEKGRIIRAMNFLDSIFQVADVDGSGALSKAEVGKYLCRKEVTDKLHSLKLFVPDWLEMFEAMDADGDGDLTWAELSVAMRRIWTQLAGAEAEAPGNSESEDEEDSLP
ncbi:unnamed protein product, partial [Effrenium voratum]